MCPFKLVVVIFIIYLADGCVAKQKHDHAIKPQERGLFDDAVSAVRNIVGEIRNPTPRESIAIVKFIAKYSAEAKDIVDEVFGFATGFIDHIKRMQSEITSSVEGRIEKFVSGAEELSERLGGEPGCIVKHIAKAGALVAQTGVNEVKCPGNKVVQLEDMVETLVKAVQTVLTMVPELAVELEKCPLEGIVFLPACDVKAVIRLGTNAGSAVAHTVGVAAEAATLTATVATGLVACATKEVATAATKAAGLVGAFSTCSGKALVDIFT